MTIRGIALFALAAIAGSALAHPDSPFLVDECASCHVGHGASGEPMLPTSEEALCYRCHGSEESRSKMVAEGWLLPGVSLGDIEREFKKPFRHPVEEGSGHSPIERLPSLSGDSARHAECVDCHNPHERIGKQKDQGAEVSGYSIGGNYLETTRYEYELCLKCHVQPGSIGTTGKRLEDQIAPQALSQHPVTVEGSGKKLPSLAKVLAPGSRMRCSSCHSSDDPNGPRGPHGSSYRYLLSDNYSTDPYGDESPYAYGLCYSCHDRSSILANESFPLHREHIVGDPLAGRSGTSCFSCHASHGSLENEHLIDFNAQIVQPESTTRLLQYRALGGGSGECYLSCHDHDHAPGSY